MRAFRPAYLVVLLLGPATLRAQSLLDRPPNLSGNWTGAPGTLHFNFLHRFTASGGPERKVSNVPTFMLAAGLPKRVLAGFNYSTNSTLAPRFPNEWELFARWTPLSEDYGAPLDLGGQVGYNNAAEGVDAEVSVGRKFGIARLMAVGRALSDPLESGNVRYAVGGGAAIRLSTYVALAADVATLTSRDSAERVAWGAGLHVAIPMTPHTLSLQVTNTLVGTMQGASRGSGDVRYGFEFTIPLTLRRYFGGREDAAVASETAVAVIDSSAMRDTASLQPLSGVERISPPPVTSAPATPTPVTPAPARAPADSAKPPAARSSAPKIPAATAPVRTSPSRNPGARQAGRVVRSGIKNISYLQPRHQITVGTTIEWTNNDPLPHTVTATDNSFSSGLIKPGKTFRHTFTTVGTFNFYCIPHPFMKGTVVVRPQ